MKITSFINRFILLLLTVVFFRGMLSAQELNRNEKQALFIYNFFKFIEWSNFDELESFKVGVMGDTNNLVYDELIKVAKTKQAKLPIEVQRVSDLKTIKDLQLIYFDKAAKPDIGEIYEATAGKPVLMVSKEFPFGKSMINFVMDDDKVQYEVNETKCAKAGLKVNKVLTLVAIRSEQVWDNLLDKVEDLANTDNKTVKIDKKDLTKLIAQQKMLLKDIEKNTKKLEAQKNQLKKQQAELSSKEKLLVETKKEIDAQKSLIAEQLGKIAKQEENLSSLNKDVVVKQQELVNQQQQLEEEKQELLAIQKEYQRIEDALKVKEILVKKQGITIDEQGNEIITKTSKIKEQKTIIWLSILFLIVVSGLGIFAYRSYLLKNKANKIILQQKGEIEEQHKILEEQHREITDSINYAKRIQDAILPPLKLVKGYMPDSFILYQPKDIVAGDFYWMEGINNLTIFAAADCTGHGVPGAMVSVVCHNAMNRAVREFMLVEPHEILDKTREIVSETFEQSDEDVRDGMDIALCTINTESKKLQFAGANNGLYFIRNGELTQIKPDKQPIGRYEDAKPFTLHEMDLEPGDVIYTFSDGYADQFGGPKGKKFMYKPFRNLLLEIHEKPMDEQHHLLMKAFEEWRGKMEQIDDVCVIGVRI